MRERDAVLDQAVRGVFVEATFSVSQSLDSPVAAA